MVYAAIKVPIGIYLLHFFRPLTQFLTALKRSDDFEGEKFDDTPRYPRKTTKKSKTKSSEKKQDNLPHYQIKFNRWRARQECPENKKESNEMQEKKMPPPCNKQESLGYDVVNPFRSYHQSSFDLGRKNTDYYKYEKKNFSKSEKNEENDLEDIPRKDDYKFPQLTSIPNPHINFIKDLCQKDENYIDSTSKKTDKPKIEMTKRSKTLQHHKKEMDRRRSTSNVNKKRKSVDKKDQQTPKAHVEDQKQFKKMKMAKPIVRRISKKQD